MFSLIKKKLAFRIILYLLAMVALFGLMMGFYIYNNSNLRLESETDLYRIHGKTLVRNFATNVNLYFGLQSGHVETLASETKSLFEDPTISYVVFYNENSQKVYENYRKGLKPEDFDFSTSTVDASKNNEIAEDLSSKKGEPFMDFAVRAKMAEESPGDFVGWVRIGISLDTLVKQISSQRIVGIALIGVVLLLGLLVVLVTLRSVMPPVNRLARAARQFGEGEYDVEVEVTSEDEIGLLSETFNEMVANIRQQTQKSAKLIENITEAIMLLTEITEKLMAITTDQATGTSEQATIVQEVVSTTGEIAATATNIANAAASVNQTAEKTSEVCNKGKEYLSGAISGMSQIHTQVEKVAGHIMNLSQQAQQIGGVIDIIKEISEQTNLLALNAALEAAGAGESGRRFSVVASEVRRLATRTLEFTESVKEVIENIQSYTGTMVIMGEDQQKYADEGTQSVQQMGEYFQHILEMVDTTLVAASEISLITKQQATASDQMVTSIHGVEDVAQQVERGGKEIESLVTELKTLADHLQSQIEEKDSA